MLIRTFSAVISSFARDTKEFLFHLSTCVLVGIPCRNGATKEENIHCQSNEDINCVKRC